MIQVSKRDFDGSITLCRIHDVLHDLAIKKAREDNFIMAFTKADDVQNRSLTQRLAIRDSRPFSERSCRKFSNLRSLLYHGHMPNISQLMRLKVLSNIDKFYEDDVYEPNKFGKLSQLRYVGLALKVRREHMDYFGKFLGDMRFLQTLDLEKQRLGCDLPDCVWHIKTLRHVLLPIWSMGPPPSADLKNLQTLSGVAPRELWEAQGLPKLSNVKVLRISSHNQVNWNITVALLGTIKNLISLVIYGYDAPMKIIDMSSFPFSHRLQKLELRNYRGTYHDQIALDVGMLPEYLITLRLDSFKFGEDPILVLEKLENLRFLYLRGSELLRLCCSTGGFCQLEELQLWGLEKLEEWKIEKGAMPKLKKLEVSSCPGLRVPDGLQYLTVLQELKWWDRRASETKQNQIRSICKHVRAVVIN